MQKTAYEMRISDWSSDVCSSDLGTRAVRQHEAVDAPVIGFAHRGMDTYLGGDAADDELADAVLLDQVRKLGIVEGALAGLVDHRLAGNGIEFGYDVVRSEEHTSELQSLMRISSAVFCLKKKTTRTINTSMQNNSKQNAKTH